MKEKVIAKIYANTLLDLGKENNVDMAAELTKLTEVINASNDLENVLFLDVFTADEKSDVLKTITQKLSLSSITTNTLLYMINEKRIALLPLIFKEIMVVDDHNKGFIRGTIEGSTDSISEEYKEKLIGALKNNIEGKQAILDYKKNENVTAGYKVTVGDFQLDATVDNQLRSFKESVLGNN